MKSSLVNTNEFKWITSRNLYIMLMNAFYNFFSKHKQILVMYILGMKINSRE